MYLAENLRKLAKSLKEGGCIQNVKDVYKAANLLEADWWISCNKRLPEKYTEVLIRYYNSREEKFLTDIAWIDDDGKWYLIREKGGYFPPNFKKEITKWRPMPED